MWTAHALTLSRIPLAIGLWFAWGNTAWSLVLLGLAAISDAADGRVARRAKRLGATGPDIGGWLDPMADKIFVAVVLAAIWVHAAAPGRAFSLVVLIGARELVLLPLVAVYLAKRVPHPAFRADVLGKAATVAQLIALCVIVVAPDHAVPGAVVAAILGVAAAVHYVVVAADHARHPHDALPP